MRGGHIKDIDVPDENIRYTLAWYFSFTFSFTLTFSFNLTFSFTHTFTLLLSFIFTFLKMHIFPLLDFIEFYNEEFLSFLKFHPPLIRYDDYKLFAELDMCRFSMPLDLQANYEGSEISVRYFNFLILIEYSGTWLEGCYLASWIFRNMA